MTDSADKLREEIRMVLPFLVCQTDRDIVETALLDVPKIGEQVFGLLPKIRWEQSVARKLVGELLELAPEKRLASIRRRRRLHTRSAVERLLELCHQAGFRDPAEAARLADVAGEVCLCLSSDKLPGGSEACLVDLRILVAAHQANAARLQCRWNEAQAHLESAYAQIPGGTGDPEVIARVYSIHGTFLRIRRRYDEALVVLEKAREIWDELGDDHQCGLILLIVAIAHAEAGSLDRAIKAQMDACLALSEQRDPVSVVAAWINLAGFYCESSKFEEAAGALRGADGGLDFLPTESTVRLAHTWMEGRSLRGLGQLAESAECFQLVIRGYSRIEDAYSAGLATLDLAIVLHQQGDLDALQQTVSEAWALLESQELKAEARAALSLLMDASKRQEVRLSALRSTALLFRKPLCRASQAD